MVSERAGIKVICGGEAGAQRVCMKGFSQFRTSVSDKGNRFGEVVLAHGSLEVS
jgi:hypothetical protein